MLRSCCSHSGALLLVLLLQASMEVRGWCMESSECQDLTVESNLLACLHTCQREVWAKMLVFPGDEQLLTEDLQKHDAGQQHVEEVGANNGLPGAQSEGAKPGLPGHHAGKRSYSMQHFRWGKPVGKKRRPVKVRPTGTEERPPTALPLEFKRALTEERPPTALPLEFKRALTEERPPTALPVEFKRALADERPEGLAESVADLEDGLVGDTQETVKRKKRKGGYKMARFRGHKPPKSKYKRQDGFMTEKMESLDQVYLNGAKDEMGERPKALEENVADLEESLVGDTQEMVKRKKRKSGYKMEHFRWGKPPKSKYKRQDGFMTEKMQSLDQVYLSGAEDKMGERPKALEESVADLEDSLVGDTQETEKKRKGGYEMEHFRWVRASGRAKSKPGKRKSKRYGGFMTEKSQTPLMTLFKNAIIKNTQDKGQ